MMLDNGFVIKNVLNNINGNAQILEEEQILVYD